MKRDPSGVDMHGIEKLPSGRLRVRFIRRGRTASEVVGTLEDALKLRDTVRADLASGDVVPVEGLSAAVSGETSAERLSQRQPWLQDREGSV